MSFKIVKFLAVLCLAGLLYALLLEPISIIESITLQNANTEQSQTGIKYMSQLWTAAPIFIFIAAAAWLIKQGVVLRS